MKLTSKNFRLLYDAVTGIVLIVTGAWLETQNQDETGFMLIGLGLGQLGLSAHAGVNNG